MVLWRVTARAVIKAASNGGKFQQPCRDCRPQAPFADSMHLVVYCASQIFFITSPVSGGRKFPHCWPQTGNSINIWDSLMVPWRSIVGIRRESSMVFQPPSSPFVTLRGYLPSAGHSGALLKKLRKSWLNAQNQNSFIAETTTLSGIFLKSMSRTYFHRCV